MLIPVLNEAAHLPRLFAALEAQDHRGAIEFLFMDAGSRDASRAILEARAQVDSRVRVLDNPGKLAPAAMNVGLRAARGRIIVRLDAHSEYPPGYVSTAVRILDEGRYEHVSGAARAIGVDRGSRQTARAMASWLGVGSAGFRKEPSEPREVDTGFVGAWRRETLDALGGFDVAAVVNEDAELAARLRKRGGRLVLVPEMTATLVPRSTLRALERQYRRYGFHRARTARLHRNSLRASALLPPSLVLCALAAVAAPAAVARLARRGMAIYAVAVTVESVRVAGAAQAPRIAAILITMHASYGTGWLVGVIRSSPPFGPAAPRVGAIT